MVEHILGKDAIQVRFLLGAPNTACSSVEEFWSSKPAVGSSNLSRPAIIKENVMKPTLFKNRLNSERFVCDDTRVTDVIDGVEYLVVHRPNEHRLFKMRRDVLEKDTAVVKGTSRDPAKV